MKKEVSKEDEDFLEEVEIKYWKEIHGKPYKEEEKEDNDENT